MNISAFKFFLFDLDDTLVDTSQVVFQSMKRWCEENNVDLQRALEISSGVRTEDTVSALAPHLDAAEEASKIDSYETSLLKYLQLKPGAMELLLTLPESSWAIVTSSSISLSRRKMRAAKLPEPTVMVTSDCVSQGKPDPEPYRLGIRRLGASPEDCLVFEDAESGVESALRAGCKVLLVGDKCDMQDHRIIGRTPGFGELHINRRLS